MAKETMFSLKLETELREAFMNAAAHVDRPASQVVRELMRDFIQQQENTRAHEAWFRAEVAQGLREADDPAVERVPHHEAAASWRRQRAEWVKQAESDAE